MLSIFIYIFITALLSVNLASKKKVIFCPFIILQLLFINKTLFFCYRNSPNNLEEFRRKNYETKFYFREEKNGEFFETYECKFQHFIWSTVRELFTVAETILTFFRSSTRNEPSKYGLTVKPVLCTTTTLGTQSVLLLLTGGCCSEVGLCYKQLLCINLLRQIIILSKFLIHLRTKYT